jgi:hypothetical protein
MYSSRSAVEIKGEVRNFGDLFHPGIAGVPPVLGDLRAANLAG